MNKIYGLLATPCVMYRAIQTSPRPRFNGILRLALITLLLGVSATGMQAKKIYIRNLSTYTGEQEIGLEYKTQSADDWQFKTGWINRNNATYTTTINGEKWFVLDVDVATYTNLLRVNVFGRKDADAWGALNIPVDLTNKEAIYLEFDPRTSYTLTDITGTVFIRNVGIGDVGVEAWDATSTDATKKFVQGLDASNTNIYFPFAWIKNVTNSSYFKTTIDEVEWFVFTFPYTDYASPITIKVYGEMNNANQYEAKNSFTFSKTKQSFTLNFSPGTTTTLTEVGATVTQNIYVLMQNDESVTSAKAWLTSDASKEAEVVVDGTATPFVYKWTDNGVAKETNIDKWQWHHFSMTTSDIASSTFQLVGTISGTDPEGGDDNTTDKNHTVTTDINPSSTDLYYFFNFNTNQLEPIASTGPSDWVNVLPHAQTFKPQEGASGRDMIKVQMYNNYNGNTRLSDATEEVILQSVHESREIIYVNTDLADSEINNPWDVAGQASRARLMLKCPYDTYQFYRFYRYNSHRPLDPNHTRGFFYAPCDAGYFPGAVPVKYFGKDGVLYTSMNAGKYWAYVTKDVMDRDADGNYLTTVIACDVSYFGDTSNHPVNDRTRNGVTYSEPTLAYRIIYELRPASEMATELNKHEITGGEVAPLENYNIIAPTSRRLNLTPKYPFRNNYRYEGTPSFQGNYHVTCSDGKIRRITDAKFVRTGIYNADGSVYDGTVKELNVAATLEAYEQVNGSGFDGFIGHCMQLNMKDAVPTEWAGKKVVYELRGYVNEQDVTIVTRNRKRDGNNDVRDAEGKLEYEYSSTTITLPEGYGYTADASKEYLIARFNIDVRDIATVGPLLNDGHVVKSETELLAENWEIVNQRRFNVNEIDNAKTREYGTVTTTNAGDMWFGEPLSWEETSCGFQYAKNNYKSSNLRLVYNTTSTVWDANIDPGLPYHGKDTEMSTYRLVRLTPQEAVHQGKAASVEDYNSKYNSRDDGGVAFINDFCMLIDAAETQDQIAHLDLQEAKCPGTKLMFSAWVKNYLFINWDEPDLPNLNFVITGAYRDGTGNLVEEDLQIFSTGTFGVVDGPDGNSVDNPKNSENTWKQILFDFTLPTDKTYEHLYLKLLNNGLNSDGNDFKIDDIVVFAKQPSVKGTTITPICGNTAEVKITIGYQVMLDAANNPSNYVDVGYTVVDNDEYFSLREAGKSHDAAWEASRVVINNGHIDGQPYFGKFRLYSDKSKYDTLKSEAEVKALRNKDFSDSPYAVLTGSEGKEEIVFVAMLGGGDLRPGRNYSLIINRSSDHNTEASSKLTDLDYYTMGEFCDMNATFTFSTAGEIRADGTPISDDDTFCADRTPTFSLGKFQYLDEDGKEQTIDNSDGKFLFDWFQGEADGKTALEEFSEQIYDNGMGGKFSAREALLAYRKAYPTSNNPEANAIGDYTSQMQDVIKNLTKSNTDNSDDAQLVLAQATYSPRLTQSGIYDFLYIPVMASIPEADQDKICNEARPFLFNAKDKAPTAQVGLPGINYGDQTVIGLRLGKAHIEATKVADSKATPTKRITLPLTNVNLESSEGTKVVQNETSKHNMQILLVGTDDPQFAASLLNSPVVGYATDFVGSKSAVNEEDNWSNKLYIYFDETAFANKVKEGYTYKLKTYFQEFDDANSVFTNACEGDLTIVLKVVPEYETWTGDGKNQDWNNDDNWKRTNPTEINKNVKSDGSAVTDTDEAYYISNSANTTNIGFAPLEDYTNITFANAGATAEETHKAVKPEKHNYLDYVAGDDTKTGVLDVNTSTATKGIAYDMAIKVPESGDYTCQKYYENRCRDIYLTAGSELMNTHLLTYRQAHIDYELTPGRWYLMGSPLKATYAGDMYAPLGTARQETDAFADITFDNTLDGDGKLSASAKNNRYNPAVYQRSWDKDASTNYEFDGTRRNAYLKAYWSFVYNDVAVAYAPGTGFSIKAVTGTGFDDSKNTLFRLPKSDSSYDYFKKDGTKGNPTNTEINRKNDKGENVIGRLFTDDMTAAGSTVTQTISNPSGNNTLFLVGNPFTTQLDMKAFFDGNPDLDKTYWLMTADKGQTATILGSDTDNPAISSDGINGTTVAPMQGFFVKKTAASSINVKFTPDMMTGIANGKTSQGLKARTRTGASQGQSADSGWAASQSSDNGQQQGSNLAILRLRTLGQDYASTLAIALNPQTSTDYRDDEDVELMVNSLTGNAPMLYTTASGHALQINQTPDGQMIPLGILMGDGGGETEVVVSGASAFDRALLYDALHNETTTLADGMTLALQNAAAGRYFVCLNSTATGIADTSTDSGLTIALLPDGTLSVASAPGHPLTHAAVWTLDGRQAASLPTSTLVPQAAPTVMTAPSATAPTVWTCRLPSGTYIVRASNDLHTATRKIQAK